MRGEHHRPAGLTCGAHAVAAGVELMERGVRVPGFIEMQHLDRVAQGAFDQFGVVAQPVVSRIGHHHELDLGLPATSQRAGIDLGLDRLAGEFAQRNRPDDPQLVALRREV